MKKMMYGSLACKVSVAEDYSLVSKVSCEYGRDTVAYAVERFLSRSAAFCRKCTKDCWEIRIAKDKKHKTKKFSYVIPSMFMELPGNWVQIEGVINEPGVTVASIKILTEHPCFEKLNSK